VFTWRPALKLLLWATQIGDVGAATAVWCRDSEALANGSYMDAFAGCDRRAALSVFLSPLERFQATLEVIDASSRRGETFPAIARTSQPRSRLPYLGIGKPKEDQDSVKGSAIRGGSAHAGWLPHLDMPTT
jgi:hypothetical protein